SPPLRRRTASCDASEERRLGPPDNEKAPARRRHGADPGRIGNRPAGSSYITYAGRPWLRARYRSWGSTSGLRQRTDYWPVPRGAQAAARATRPDGRVGPNFRAGQHRILRFTGGIPDRNPHRLDAAFPHLRRTFGLTQPQFMRFQQKLIDVIPERRIGCQITD